MLTDLDILRLRKAFREDFMTKDDFEKAKKTFATKDELRSLSKKVDAILVEIHGLISKMGGTLEDHEERIVKLERLV